jgi:hypothetical protein
MIPITGIKALRFRLFTNKGFLNIQGNSNAEEENRIPFSLKQAAMHPGTDAGITDVLELDLLSYMLVDFL